MSEVQVVDVPERSRFEVRVDGELAGFAEYRTRPGVVTFTHTEVDDAFGGRGLGGTLVRAALDAARERGLAVHPACPFVRSWIGRHPAYVDLVPAGERARYGLDGPSRVGRGAAEGTAPVPPPTGPGDRSPGA